MNFEEGLICTTLGNYPSLKTKLGSGKKVGRGVPALNGGGVGMSRLEGEHYQKPVWEMKRPSDVTEERS